MIIKCDYAKAVEDTSEILKYQYSINDTNIYETQTIEHEFLVAGIHKITLKVYAANGTSSTLEKYVTINAIYLQPKASFTTFADFGYKVKLDSSESFKQSRKVTRFIWDFGDGLVDESSESEILHTFPNAGSYNITLTVVDERGVINTISKILYVYNSDVPEPGEVNSDTIEGIDSDNDGVRDDVQRWINYESKENSEIKNLLKKLAQNYQLQILNNNDPNKIKEFERKKDKISTCLLGKINNDEQMNYYLNILQYLYSSTELRSEAWSLVQGNLGGYSVEVPSLNQAIRLQSCEEI